METSLVFKNNALLPTLYGEGDSHLTAIEKRFNVVAASRGNVLAISGKNQKDIEASRQILQQLYNQLELGVDVGLDQVNAAIRMSDHQPNHVVAKSASKEFADGDCVIKTAKKYIRPYSPAQAEYINKLKNHDLVFALGPAGTGKTYIAVAQAVAAFMARDVERIILSRPAVEAGEKLGFLPGDLKEKIDPYLRPLYDALYDMLPAEKVVRFFETGEIEVAPLAFMRGRTLSHAYVILDESQNTTPTQMKMFLTRLGEGSRMIITGDPSQIDLPKDIKSGLTDAVRKLENIDDIGTVRFDQKDVVRHPLAAKIVSAYDEWDKKKKNAMTADQSMNSLTMDDIIDAIKSEAVIHGEATIKWCNDKEIQQLNYQFRGINKPTNVLSFPDGADGYLGDIAISLDTIRREAKEQGKDTNAHLAHMIIHGVLHLLGYDHEDDDAANQMESLEINILNKLSIDNPYQ